MNINRKKIFLFVFAIIVIPISVTFLPLYIFCYITHTRFEWFNLWGTCISSISSALIALSGVYLTVKETRRIQKENSEDANNKVLTERNERLKKERRELTNTLSVYIGKYITHTQLYYWAIVKDYTLRNELRGKETSLKANEASMAQNDMTEIHHKRLSSMEKTKEEIQQIKKEIEINTTKGNRITASECYFILKTQLSAVNEADELLKKLDYIHSTITKVGTKGGPDEDWLRKETDELMRCFNIFKENYENVE